MLKGEINILGYSVFGELILNPASRIKALIIMDPISFADGLIQVQLACNPTSPVKCVLACSITPTPSHLHRELFHPH